MGGAADSLGLEDVFRETVIELGKAYGKDVAKEAFVGLSKLAQDLAVDATGVLIGSICKCLLQALLNRQQALVTKVDTMLREPMLTGINVGSEAFLDTSTSLDAVVFRQRRLTFAVERLDEARTICPNGDSSQRLLVTLLQAFFLTQINGASALARARFREVRPLIVDQIEVLTKLASNLKNRAQTTRDDARREMDKNNNYGQRAVDIFIHPATYRYQAEILHAAANDNEAQSAIAQTSAQCMLQIVVIIDAYCQVSSTAD